MSLFGHDCKPAADESHVVHYVVYNRNLIMYITQLCVTTMLVDTTKLH